MLFLQLLFISLGLVFGSFIAALSWRYPRGLSVAEGRSICPKCKKQIDWFDNIPLLSYLFLGGKCRYCKKSISTRYPIIEFITALGFLTISLALPLQGASFKVLIDLVYALTIFSILVIILVIDFEHKIIPDDFVFFGIGITFIFLLFTNSQFIIQNMFAGILSAFLLLLIHLFTRGLGMGLGDVKFAILGGILVGMRLNLIWLFLSFLTGGITGIILILGKKAGLKDQIAFGPFLVISIGLTFLIGDKLLTYMGLI